MPAQLILFIFPFLIGVAARVIDGRSQKVWSLIFLIAFFVAYNALASDSIGRDPEELGMNKLIADVIVLPAMLIGYAVCFGVLAVMNENGFVGLRGSRKFNTNKLPGAK
jgi:hypothetical protein